MKLQYDYYKILQVHTQAEPEIIDSAYKRLVRKYHPDVSTLANSVEMMQMINEAYSVLSNRDKREQYNKEWESVNHKPVNNENNNSSERKSMFVNAKLLLDDYFKNIMDKDYSHCYDLISEPDKLNISKEDFINWQDAVSKIYQMTEYNCEFYGVYKNKLLNGQMYHDVLEFNINTLENNIIMDMTQKDRFTKMVLLEDGKWKVYVGYEKLQPIITKFQDLKGLLNAKSVINELMEKHNKVDIPTGLLNQRGIIESIEKEIYRHDRYGNSFSLIMCDIDLIRLINLNEEIEIINGMFKIAGELLSDYLRKLDTVGRWSDKSLLILLPETGLIDAIKVSYKIQKLFQDHNLDLYVKKYKLVANFGITEYYSSLEESLDRIYFQIR